MKLYFKYFMMHLRAQMQYKKSFIFLTLGQFALAFSGYIMIVFMFTRFSSVRGFSYSEVLLCYAIVLAAFSLAECFFRGFDAFSSIISNGEFDRIMVRPRNVILQVLGQKIEITRLGRLVQAAIVFGFTVPTCGVEWTPARVGVMLLMIASGVIVFSGLFIIYATLCFFTTEGLEFMNIFTDGGREFGRYPFSVYGSEVLKFYTYIIPLALFQYYPLLYITGRSDSPLYALTPLIAVLFIIPCLVFWRVGVRHYKSTGS